MAMAAPPLSLRISIKYTSNSCLNALNNQFVLNVPLRLSLTVSFRRVPLIVQASKSPTEVNAAIAETTVNFQDLKYLLKVGAGSIAGAAAIKYGSVIFPEFTRPNIVQALLMIFAPTAVALVLLFNQSRSE